jgi:hypothetical protein
MLGLSSVFSTKHCNIKKLILNHGLFDAQNYDIEIILQKRKRNDKTSSFSSNYFTTPFLGNRFLGKLGSAFASSSLAA